MAGNFNRGFVEVQRSKQKYEARGDREMGDTEKGEEN